MLNERIPPRLVVRVCLCLKLCLWVVHAERLLHLYVKSVSVHRFHSSPIFCVTGLKGSLYFSGEH